MQSRVPYRTDEYDRIFARHGAQRAIKDRAANPNPNDTVPHILQHLLVNRYDDLHYKYKELVEDYGNLTVAINTLDNTNKGLIEKNNSQARMIDLLKQNIHQVHMDSQAMHEANIDNHEEVFKAIQDIIARLNTRDDNLKQNMLDYVDKKYATVDYVDKGIDLINQVIDVLRRDVNTNRTTTEENKASIRTIKTALQTLNNTVSAIPKLQKDVYSTQTNLIKLDENLVNLEKLVNEKIEDCDIHSEDKTVHVNSSSNYMLYFIILLIAVVIYAIISVYLYRKLKSRRT